MSVRQNNAVDLEGNDRVNPPELSTRENGMFLALKGYFHGIPIGKKISLFFGLNLGFALIAGLAVLFAFIEIGKQSEQAAQANQAAFIAEKVVLGISQAQRHRENFFANEDAVRGNAALDEFDRVLVSLERLGTVEGMSTGSNSIQVTALTEAVIEHCRELNLALQGELADRSPALKLESDEHVSATLVQARELAEELERASAISSATSQSFIATILTIWIGLASALVLLTLLAQRYFDRHVGGALSDLAQRMSSLSSGQNVSNIEASNRGDEIGEMTRAMMVFHQTSVELNRLNAERSQKAQEELEEQARRQQQEEEARRERKQALSDIASQFEHTIGDVVTKVASASSELQCTATSMATGAQQAADQISEVTSSMREANSGATAAAAASDQFAMSINEVSRQATSSAELAREASSSAKQADATLTKLSDSAQEVGHIVELIQTIAQRTNLLALNASIEAARGGQSGRGFAVVANEVKELAMQTSRATEEVAGQIRAMQDTTGESVAALHSIASQVAELEDNAASIASAVNEQSVAGQDLARSIDMAARGTENVSDHITEVHELSSTTGTAAGQVLESATALEQQAATLHAQVNDFLDEVRVG